MDNAREIDWHAGAARPLEIPVYEEDPRDRGEPDLAKPIDLSGASAIRFGIAGDVNDVTLLVDKKLSDVITVIAGPEAVANVIRIPILAADTKSLTPGRLYYEVQVVDGGDDWRARHGVFHLHASLLK